MNEKNIYTNMVSVETGIYDISLKFSLSNMEIAQKGEAPEDILRVFMSPIHAKALLTLLAENIAAYEAKFGKIPDFREYINQEA